MLIVWKLSAYSAINANFCFYNWQITDAVVAARILNATLVVPKLDQRSYWKDSRLVTEGTYVFLVVVVFAVVLF